MYANDSVLLKIRRFCAFQDRSEMEVRRKLLSYSLPPVQIEEIIQELKKEKFVDDNRYAGNFIRSKISQKQWGRIKITGKLREKGIDPEIIQIHLHSIADTDFQLSVRNAIEKWLRSNELNKITYPKLYRSLAGKGFEHELIIQNLKNYVDKN